MKGFKDVIGHNDIIQYIQNAVTEGKVSQAYILNGERGSGKKMLANLFAMTLFELFMACFVLQSYYVMIQK